MKSELDLRKVWSMITQFYGKDFVVAELFAKLCEKEGITAKQVYLAWLEHLKGEHAMRFPSLHDLKKAMNPAGFSARQVALQIASMLPIMVTKHGQYWPQGVFSHGNRVWEGKDGSIHASFEEAIASYVGPAWPIFSERWAFLCAQFEENKTATFAQLRDLIESFIVTSNLPEKSFRFLLSGGEDVERLESRAQLDAPNEKKG